MKEKDTLSRQPKVPDYSKQRGTIPVNIDERSAIAAYLHQEVHDLLTSEGIVILVSSYRAKTDASIRARFGRRLLYQRPFPIVDIYGTRFVIEEENVDKAKDLIVAHYSPDGQKVEYDPTGDSVRYMPFVIDHRNPDVKLYSSINYKAVHIYFPFDGNEYYHIGEVQLSTPNWMRITNRTRRLK